MQDSSFQSWRMNFSRYPPARGTTRGNHRQCRYLAAQSQEVGRLGHARHRLRQVQDGAIELRELRCRSWRTNAPLAPPTSMTNSPSTSPMTRTASRITGVDRSVIADRNMRASTPVLSKEIPQKNIAAQHLLDTIAAPPHGFGQVHQRRPERRPGRRLAKCLRAEGAVRVQDLEPGGTGKSVRRHPRTEGIPGLCPPETRNPCPDRSRSVPAIRRRLGQRVLVEMPRQRRAPPGYQDLALPTPPTRGDRPDRGRRGLRVSSIA